MKLHHFVWYPVAGKGYQEKPIAASGSFNPLLYTSLFKNEFIPIVVSYSKEDFRAYLLFNRPDRNKVLFSCIFPKKRVDEHGRTGVFNHSAIISKADIKRGMVSFFRTEKAMREFDDKNPMPKGKIEPLNVRERAKPAFSYVKKLPDFVSKAAVETLATRLMRSKSAKTILRCKGASKADRFKMAVYLAELLNFRCGIRPISFSTEVPTTSEYYELFDLLVLERAFPPEANADKWQVILWDLDTPSLPKLKKASSVYKKIDAAFK